jgi:transcriptional regulator GlxA family with amidase domain
MKRLQDSNFAFPASKELAMKKVTILAVEGAMADSIVGPMQVFSQAGLSWNIMFGIATNPYFETRIVTMDGKPINAFNQLSLHPHGSACDVEKTDLIIVGSFYNPYVSLSSAPDAIPWLKKHYENGTTIASVCMGAFLLAETGLLDGKTATTHWGYAQLFQKMYPKVHLKRDQMIVDDGDLLSSGACTSYMDLSLYLVERCCGHPVAVECAKVMIHDFDRRSQSAYAVCAFYREHNDSEILTAQRWIEKNYAEAIDLDQVAFKNGMSRRTFERRFKAATGITPLLYLQRTRIESAKSLLENSNHTFDEITYGVGYEDSSFFRKLFTKHTGLRPKEYQTKFRRA